MFGYLFKKILQGDERNLIHTCTVLFFLLNGFTFFLFLFGSERSEWLYTWDFWKMPEICTSINSKTTPPTNLQVCSKDAAYFDLNTQPCSTESRKLTKNKLATDRQFHESRKLRKEEKTIMCVNRPLCKNKKLLRISESYLVTPLCYKVIHLWPRDWRGNQQLGV